MGISCLMFHFTHNYLIATYPKNGTNMINTNIAKNDFKNLNKKTNLGQLWINEKQYFDNVPLVAWEFYIGGYQPAKKWLKDRKYKELSIEDVLHYQKIIISLTETARIMKEIAAVNFVN